MEKVKKWQGGDELLTTRLLKCWSKGLDCSTCGVKCPLYDGQKKEGNDKKDE